MDEASITSDQISEFLSGLNSRILERKSKLFQSGYYFNAFRLTDRLYDETTLHTPIIAELLDPYGCHGQKVLFLELFLKKLQSLTNIPVPMLSLDTEQARVYREFNIGNKSETTDTGGRIDIYLIIPGKKGYENELALVIENKINAGEQKNQLLRYHRFLETHKNAHKVLLYLTPDGKESATAFDTAGNPLNYIPISYNGFILDWLKDCHKGIEKNEAFSGIVNTIYQYSNAIEIMINMEGNKMADSLNDTILKNLDAAYMVKNKFDNTIKVLFDSIMSTLYDKIRKLIIDFPFNKAVYYDNYFVFSHKVAPLELFVEYFNSTDWVNIGIRIKQGVGNHGFAPFPYNENETIKPIPNYIDWNSWRIKNFIKFKLDYYNQNGMALVNVFSQHEIMRFTDELANHICDYYNGFDDVNGKRYDRSLKERLAEWVKEFDKKD